MKVKALPQTAREFGKDEVKLLNFNAISLKSLNLEKRRSIDNDSSSAILDTIVLKKSHVNFKRLNEEEGSSKPNMKLRLRNSIFDTSNKKLNVY